MSVLYEEFLTEVSPYCLDAPQPQMLAAIRNTVIDFCERTGIWQQKVELEVVVGQREYTLPTPPSESRHARVMHAWYEGRALYATSGDALANSSSLNWMEREGVPRFYTEQPGGVLVLDRSPDDEAPEGMVVVRALTPMRNSSEVGLDIVFEKYLEGIASGALARLYLTQGQPYYNPKAAPERMMLYTRAVKDGKMYVNSGFGRGKNTVAQRPFARGIRP